MKANVLMEKDGKQTEVCNDDSVKVMQDLGWSLVEGEKESAKAEKIPTRAEQDEGAKTATAAQLREALTSVGIAWKTNNSKAELLELWLNRP